MAVVLHWIGLAALNARSVLLGCLRALKGAMEEAGAQGEKEEMLTGLELEVVRQASLGQGKEAPGDSAVEIIMIMGGLGGKAAI